MNEHQLVFICGLHRSGTSVLHQCLREHPEISGFADTGVPEDEGQHLQSVIPAALALGGPGRFGFAPGGHLTESACTLPERMAEKLFGEWSRWWDLDKRVLIEKSPPNLVRTRFLQALFPSAVFIVIRRHPVAVALATRRFHRFNRLDRLIAHWLHCHHLYRQDAPRLARVINLRYEDFVLDPDRHLAEIYHTLGVEAVPRTVEISPGINDKYFAEWRRLQRRWGIGGWLRGLSSRYEAAVRDYQYSMLDLETP